MFQSSKRYVGKTQSDGRISGGLGERCKICESASSNFANLTTSSWQALVVTEFAAGGRCLKGHYIIGCLLEEIDLVMIGGVYVSY